MNIPREATDGFHYLEKKGVADAVRSYVEEKINSDELDILADDAELFRFIDEIEKKWNIDVLSEDYVINEVISYYNDCFKEVWKDESLRELCTKDKSAQVLFNAICYGIGMYVRKQNEN